jgi:hypothetical protein
MQRGAWRWHDGSCTGCAEPVGGAWSASFAVAI